MKLADPRSKFSILKSKVYQQESSWFSCFFLFEGFIYMILISFVTMCNLCIWVHSITYVFGCIQKNDGNRVQVLEVDLAEKSIDKFSQLHDHQQQESVQG